MERMMKYSIGGFSTPFKASADQYNLDIFGLLMN